MVTILYVDIMIKTRLTRLSGGIRSAEREELCILVERTAHAVAVGGAEEVTAQQLPWVVAESWHIP